MAILNLKNYITLFTNNKKFTQAVIKHLKIASIQNAVAKIKMSLKNHYYEDYR